MWTEEHREKYKDDSRRYPSDLTDVGNRSPACDVGAA